MAFSSLVFLLIFFPLVIGAYHIVPQRLKNVFLLLASLFFYAWGGFHALPRLRTARAHGVFDLPL